MQTLKERKEGMENNPQSMQCIPTQSQSDQDSSSNVAFVAKLQNILQEWLLMIITLFIQFFIQFLPILPFHLLLLEIIHGSEIMPIFEFIWIIRQIINIGLVYEFVERLYEKYKVWRKICFYKRKILKAIMTSWLRLRFVNF